MRGIIRTVNNGRDCLRFEVVSGEKVSDALWREVASLFSAEYGTYSAAEPTGKAGRPIRLGTRYYQASYASSAYRLATCRDGDRLVAEIVYRLFDTDRGRVAFVVQLVVDSSYRRRGIASTLLHAVWGFSDFYAWGIVTSNAFTVESLEGATFRKTSPAVISRERDWLSREIVSKIAFLNAGEWRLNDGETCVNTHFFTDRQDRRTTQGEVPGRLGALAEGEEWLAVVFRDQRPDDFSAYREMVDASSELVREAYARMPQSGQAWASKTGEEISAVLRWLPPLASTARICDFGAGTGRHVEELRRLGYACVDGVDFAAREGSGVLRADCRTWKGAEPYDLILCLYDVVGSFPDDVDNFGMLANVAANLKPGGHAVVSVSNFDYHELRMARAVDLESPDSLADVFALPPSDTMQRSGEFFNPNYLLIDERRHVVCHKEQFPALESRLPGEYLIRERRYTAEEISAASHAAGLHVLQRHFVRSGFAETERAMAKEILLLTRKA